MALSEYWGTVKILILNEFKFKTESHNGPNSTSDQLPFLSGKL